MINEKDLKNCTVNGIPQEEVKKQPQKDIRNCPLEICMLDDNTIIVETGREQLDYTPAFDCLEDHGLEYELMYKRFRVIGGKKKLYKYLQSLTLFYNLFIY